MSELAPLRNDPDEPRARAELLTLRQVAQLLGVSPGRVRQLVATGALLSVKIGRSRYVAREQVEIFNWKLRRPIGRPKGAARYRVDVLGRRRRIKYPKRNNYAEQMRRERRRQRELTQLYNDEVRAAYYAEQKAS